MLPLDIFFVAFIVVMVVQGVINIYLNLYIWEEPSRIEKTASPGSFSEPATSFTVLLPARHEQAVIGDTIKRIASADYPSELLEILVICEYRDTETIDAASTALSEAGAANGHVIVFHDAPINKPHGLNKGLAQASKAITVVFDAEDEVHPDIFNIANSIYQQTDADIIQAGVQLMNVKSSWYSVHNVLEYYFWFKSRMHFHTEAGMVPLGGNTVFFRTLELRLFGGWDETCLTEDAEIGIRMSSAGQKIVSTYDPRHVTKEETPHTVQEFIKQRTRWNQGFIQVLKLGHWRAYDTFVKKALCFYTLSFPIFQALLFLATPLVIYAGVTVNFPFLLSLLSFVPLLMFIVQVIVYAVGLHEFLHEQKVAHSPLLYLVMFAGFIPYQILLSIGALRGTLREIRGINNWEKTAHRGLHRTLSTSTVKSKKELRDVNL